MGTYLFLWWNTKKASIFFILIPSSNMCTSIQINNYNTFETIFIMLMNTFGKFLVIESAWIAFIYLVIYRGGTRLLLCKSHVQKFEFQVIKTFFLQFHVNHRPCVRLMYFNHLHCCSQTLIQRKKIFSI